MFLALIIVLCILVPVAELWFILELADWLGGGATGALVTVAMLMATSVLGAFLLRSQGLAAWSRFLNTVSQRRLPQREIVDGIFIVIGGVLLLTPGFLTDIVGLVFLLPPSRKVFANAVTGRLSKRVRRAAGVEGWEWQAGESEPPPKQPTPPPTPPGAESEIIDGIAIEEDIEFEFEQKRLEGS